MFWQIPVFYVLIVAFITKNKTVFPTKASLIITIVFINKYFLREFWTYLTDLNFILQLLAHVEVGFWPIHPHLRVANPQ